jgi:hypothetical protein
MAGSRPLTVVDCVVWLAAKVTDAVPAWVAVVLFQTLKLNVWVSVP